MRNELNNCKVDLQDARAETAAAASSAVTTSEDSATVAELKKQLAERDTQLNKAKVEVKDLNKICDELMVELETREKEKVEAQAKAKEEVEV